MHIPLVYEHLFYKYFDRQSVGQATKGNNVKMSFRPQFQFSLVHTYFLKFETASLLMDVVILVFV